MQAYVHGTSTRKVDDLVEALGVDRGISKSEVSRICAELDHEAAAFGSRSLAHSGSPMVGHHLPQGTGMAGVAAGDRTGSVDGGGGWAGRR